MKRIGTLDCSNRKLALSRLVVLSCMVLLLGVGCSREPVDRATAVKVKSGMLLSEAKELLGEPATPTSKQMKRLRQVFEHMPAETHKNAEADTALSWGNDEGFLAVVVNDEGKIWVTATGFGGGSPRQPPPSGIPAGPQQ